MVHNPQMKTAPYQLVLPARKTIQPAPRLPNQDQPSDACDSLASASGAMARQTGTNSFLDEQAKSLGKFECQTAEKR